MGLALRMPVGRACTWKHEHGSPYGKIMFRLAGVDTAWFGGNHRSDAKASVRANMLENVRRQHTVHVD